MLPGKPFRKSDVGHGDVKILDPGKGVRRWDRDGRLVRWMDRADVVDAVLI